MRELKFRIWNGTRFVTNADTYIKTSDGSLWDYEEDCFHTLPSHKKLWSADGKIHQYTGLKDKNGVEIYEGDIVKLDEQVELSDGVVMNSLYVFDFYEGSFTRPIMYNSINGSKYIKHQSGRAKLDDNLHFDLTKAEVVGNIFESSELLIKL